MRKYKKKPVVIEAIQLTKDNVIQVYEMVHNVDLFTLAMEAYAEVERTSEMLGGILINTLEGEMLASFGDYIIRGIKGEFYPCKPDIFEITYEVVEND